MPRKLQVWFILVVIFQTSKGIAQQVNATGSPTPSNWAVRSADPLRDDLKITLKNGHTILVPHAKFQCSFDDIKFAPDGMTVGWVEVGDLGSNTSAICFPTAMTADRGPTIWRAGNIIRSFVDLAGVIDWSFAGNGDRVAYYAGPKHFDDDPLCELHDLTSGKLLAKWSASMKTPAPAWTAGLYCAQL